MRLSAPVFRLKRQAKLAARAANIPLHAALDRIARDEGFRSWSHLCSSLSGDSPVRTFLAHLNPGDLVLLGGRPGHGKTLLGLGLAVEAARAGRQGFFFTLDYSDADMAGLLPSLDAGSGSRLSIDTADTICADHIVAQLRGAEPGAVAVIDYLQALDQRRSTPALSLQVRTLKACAEDAGAIIVALSQIDRAFDRRVKRIPDLSDVRLPNPVDLSLFTKTCFVHEGEIQLAA